MRVLFALHQFFPEHAAGTETVTLRLARELRARGNEVHVLAARRSTPHQDIEAGEIEDYELHGVPVRRVGRPREEPRLRLALEYRNGVMAARAREYAREIEPDIVHVMHLQGISASVLGVFRELGLPIVYTATDFWPICPTVDLRRHDGVMCTGPALEHCVRCIVCAQHSQSKKLVVKRTPAPVLRAGGRLAGVRLGRRLRLLRQIGDVEQRPAHIRERLELVDRMTAPSRFMSDMLASNGIEGVEVVSHGVEAGSAPKPRAGGSRHPLRIGFIGTLGRHKGCDILIRAFRGLGPRLDATLTIHGNEARFPDFVERLRELAGDDERIEFAGTFPSGDAGRALSGIDVLVVPSRWYENAPLVIYEAFAAGVPVVATDLGGMAEAVDHERDGLLFELEDVTDLARQLWRLQDDPDLLDRLRSGVAPVKTLAEEVDDLERIYESLLAERSGPG